MCINNSERSHAYVVLHGRALQVALPHMGETERFEVRQLKGHCVYEVTCLFGFRDTVTQDRPFIQGMLRKICKDIRYRAMAAR